MSIFDAYDAEFGSLKDEVLKNIAGLKEDLANNENPTPLLKLVDGLFMQSHDLIKQMELEARSNDPAMRKKMNETVAGYKKSLQTMKADFQTCRAQHDRAQLGTGKSSEQRQRLLDTTERIDRQNEMLSNAHRAVTESEEVGLEITAELARNREKIESSRAKAGEYAGIGDSARKLISTMGRRDSRQRYLAVFVLTIVIVVVVVFMVKR